MPLKRLRCKQRTPRLTLTQTFGKQFLILPLPPVFPESHELHFPLHLHLTQLRQTQPRQIFPRWFNPGAKRREPSSMRGSRSKQKTTSRRIRQKPITNRFYSVSPRCFKSGRNHGRFHRLTSRHRIWRTGNSSSVVFNWLSIELSWKRLRITVLGAPTNGFPFCEAGRESLSYATQSHPGRLGPLRSPRWKSLN